MNNLETDLLNNVYNLEDKKENLYDKLLDVLMIDDNDRYSKKYEEKAQLNENILKKFINFNYENNSIINEGKNNNIYEDKYDNFSNNKNNLNTNDEKDPHLKRYLDKMYLIKKTKDDLIKHKINVEKEKLKLENIFDNHKNINIINDNPFNKIDCIDKICDNGSNIEKNKINRNISNNGFTIKSQNYSISNQSDTQKSSSANYNEKENKFHNKLNNCPEEENVITIHQNDLKIKSNSSPSSSIGNFINSNKYAIKTNYDNYDFKNSYSEKDFIFLTSNKIDEVNRIFDISRFIKSKEQNIHEYNKLIKITVPKNTNYEEFIVYFITKENPDLEFIKTIYISNLKKSLLYSIIPEEIFMKYLELILLGKNKKAIPQRDAINIFLDDIENYLTLKDNKLGFFDYRFIELYFLIDFKELNYDYKNLSSLQKKNLLSNKMDLKKSNYPILKFKLDDFILIPSYEEIMSMPLDLIKNTNLTIENKYGKLIYLEPIDLEGVNLDAINLSYFYFEISNKNLNNFSKLNKTCKVCLFTDEIKNDQDYIICLKKLKQHYKNKKVKKSFYK